MAGTITLTTDGGTAIPLSLSIDAGALTLAGQTVSTSLSGTLYAGYTPTIYAAPADVGSGDGSSEANAMDLVTALSATTINGMSTASTRVIGLLPGTYTSSYTPARHDPSWAPLAGGTVSSPLVIVAKYPAVTLGDTAAEIAASSDKTELRNGLSPALWGGGGPTFGPTRASDGLSYVSWIGVYVLGYQNPTENSTGFAFMGGENNTIAKCAIVGHDIGSKSVNDNRSCIHAELAENCEISDNLIYCCSGSDQAEMANGLTTYSCVELNVTHNTWVQTGESGVSSGGAINFKANRDASQSGVHFRWNIVRGGTAMSYGIIINDVDGTLGESYIERNLFDASGIADGRTMIAFDPIASSYGDAPSYITCQRNTLIGTRTSTARGMIQFINPALLGSAVIDNLIYNYDYTGPFGLGSYDEMTAAEFAALSGLTCDYNVVYASRYASFNGTDYTTPADLYSATGKDQHSTRLTSSSNIFQDYAAGNYRPGSAVTTLSSTGGPVGCYDASGGEVPGIRV